MNEQEQLAKDLAMLVARLTRRMTFHGVYDDVARAADDFLTRKCGHMFSPLRSPPSGESGDE